MHFHIISVIRASSIALSFTVAPLGHGVASSPGSLPGDEATLGGVPISVKGLAPTLVH